MRRVAALVGGAGVLLLAGCAPTVSLTPAPQATTVACARVITALPDTLAGAAHRETDAQGTAAWGDDPAITLTCGGSRTPSSQCGTVDGVDWTDQDASVGGRAVVVLTTYGREPVIQVVKPSEGASQTAQISANDVLVDVTDAVRRGTRATGVRCGIGAPTSAAPSGAAG